MLFLLGAQDTRVCVCLSASDKFVARMLRSGRFSISIAYAHYKSFVCVLCARATRLTHARICVCVLCTHRMR